MANEENLKKGVATQFRTGEEQVRIAKQGGIKSGEARREKKLIKDRILERMGADDWDEYIDGIIARAKESKADAEFLRDTIGQKPIDKVAVTNIDQSLEELNEYFNRTETPDA